MMEKFLENLQEADRIIKNVDHMLYVTFPLIKDKRLLLKILLETKAGIAKCINAILQNEYLYKRISLNKDPKSFREKKLASQENFRIFELKCSEKYNITKEEIKLILELFDFAKRHKESPFEFSKGDKIVIFSNNSIPQILTIEKIKKFLELAKNILNKTKYKISLNLR